MALTRAETLTKLVKQLSSTLPKVADEARHVARDRYLLSTATTTGRNRRTQNSQRGAGGLGPSGTALAKQVLGG